MPAKKKLGAVKKASKKKAGEFYLEIDVNGTTYRGEAPDLAVALKDFVSSPSFPKFIKTRVLLKYGDGKVESQRTIFVPAARRMFTIISRKPESLELWALKLTQALA